MVSPELVSIWLSSKKRQQDKYPGDKQRFSIREGDLYPASSIPMSRTLNYTDTCSHWIYTAISIWLWTNKDEWSLDILVQADRHVHLALQLNKKGHSYIETLWSCGSIIVNSVSSFEIKICTLSISIKAVKLYLPFVTKWKM